MKKSLRIFGIYDVCINYKIAKHINFKIWMYNSYITISDYINNISDGISLST